MDEVEPRPDQEPAAETATEASPAVVAADTPLEPVPASPSRRRLRVAVALTLVGVAGLLVALQAGGLAGILGGSTGTADVDLPPRLVAIDADGVLATMDDRGGSVVRHPVDGVSFEFPAWSPDGSRVAAIGNLDGSDIAGIYVFRARDGSADPATATDPTVIYQSGDSPPFYLYWAPDGRQVTFLTQETDRLALRVAPADGSSPGAVVRRGAPLYWDWVDPARALVNVGAGSPDAFLGEVGLDGAAGSPTAASPGIFRSPAVSHDGSHRAFIIDTGGGTEAIVVESRTGTGRLEIPVSGLAAVSFAPNGRSVAFVAPPAPDPDTAGLPIGPLQLIDVASGSVRTLLDGKIVGFFWSPDGRTIAALRIPGPGELDVASAVGLAPPAAAFAGAATFRPAATSAGYDLPISFVDVASGDLRSTQRITVTDRFALQLLPYFDQYALSHRLWSPDSAAIVLPLVADNGVDGLVVLAADGSAPRRVADGEMGFWSP